MSIIFESGKLFLADNKTCNVVNTSKYLEVFKIKYLFRF